MLERCIITAFIVIYSETSFVNVLTTTNPREKKERLRSKLFVQVIKKSLPCIEHEVLCRVYKTPSRSIL